MIVLGIDPGTTAVGYSLLKKEGFDIYMIEAGLIKILSRLPQPEKLLQISEKLSEIIDIHSPDILALEKIYFFKNNKTIMAVSEARGAILLTAQEKGLKISEYTPLEIKMAVTGYGRADKNQISRMVKALLKLKDVEKTDDVTDAMAIAVCCLNTKKYQDIKT